MPRCTSGCAGLHCRYPYLQKSISFFLASHVAQALLYDCCMSSVRLLTAFRHAMQAPKSGTLSQQAAAAEMALAVLATFSSVPTLACSPEMHELIPLLSKVSLCYTTHAQLGKYFNGPLVSLHRFVACINKKGPKHLKEDWSLPEDCIRHCTILSGVPIS